MNREKTVLLLAKANTKHTRNETKFRDTRKVNPFNIKYENGESVKIVDSAEYLGSVLNRKIDATTEIKRRVGMGFQKADNSKAFGIHQGPRLEGRI